MNGTEGDGRVNSAQRQPPFAGDDTRRIVATSESHRFPGGRAVFTTIVPTG